MRGSFGASRAVPLASRPRERMPYAVTLMPSSRTTGRICASMPRLISEYSICSAAIGWTACARRIVSAPHLGQADVTDVAGLDHLGDRPTVSSIGTCGSSRAGWYKST
jgi:hypothetical protein